MNSSKSSSFIAANISFAVMVCLFDSRAKSLAHVAKYIQKNPQAREKAIEASFPTFVDLGKEFFRMRRMHAKGGSNSLITPAVTCWLLEEVVAFSTFVVGCAAAMVTVVILHYRVFDGASFLVSSFYSTILVRRKSLSRTLSPLIRKKYGYG